MMRVALSLAVACTLAVACGKDEAAGKKFVAAIQSAAPTARQGAWHGTVHVKQSAAGEFPSSGSSDFSEGTIRVSMDHQVNWMVDGEARAKIAYSEDKRSESRTFYDAYTLSGTTHLLTTASGMSPEAHVDFNFYSDGTYALNYFARSIAGELESESTTVVTCKPNVDPECKNRNDHSHTIDPIPDLGYMSGSAEGRIDRKDSRHLTGSYAEDFEYGDGVTGKTVVTWDLSQ